MTIIFHGDVSGLLNNLNNISSTLYLSSESLVNRLTGWLDARLSEAEASIMVNEFKESTNSLIDDLNISYKWFEPKLALSTYLDSDTNKFSSTNFILDINDYITRCGESLNAISEYTNSTTFKRIIENGDGILISPQEIEKRDEVKKSMISDEKISYYTNMFIKPYLDGITSGISEIQNEIVLKIENSVKNLDKSLFEFKKVGNVTFDVASKTSYDNNIKSDSIGDPGIKAIKLNENNKNSVCEYLKLDGNKIINYIANVLFNPNYESNIEDPESKYKSSIMMWAKANLQEIAADDLGFIEFKFGNNDIVLNPSSIRSHKSSNEESFVNLSNNNDVFNEHANDWILWEIQIDLSKVNNDSPKLGFRMFAHTYYKNENNELIHNKIELNGYNNSDVENNYNYISMPISINDLSSTNFEIYVGYNRYKTSQENSFNIKYFNGYLRNLMFFKGILNENQSKTMFDEGIQSYYGLLSQYSKSSLKKVIEQGHFFIGLLGSYNNTNINIINCIMKHNGKSYII